MSYRVIKDGLKGEKGGTEGEKKKERDVIQHSAAAWALGRVQLVLERVAYYRVRGVREQQKSSSLPTLFNKLNTTLTNKQC